MHKTDLNPGPPIFTAIMIIIAVNFLTILPVIPSKNGLHVLQEMHMPFGNYYLLKILNLLMEMEDGAG